MSAFLTFLVLLAVGCAGLIAINHRRSRSRREFEAYCKRKDEYDRKRRAGL